MRVLGIDPGSIRTGFAVLEEIRPNRFSIVAGGTILLNEREHLSVRLVRLVQDLKEIIEEYDPEELALENVFFAKNAQSALKLGHTRGVVLMKAAEASLRIFEYTPAEVKSSICGSGRAGKEEIARMVKILLRLPKKFEFSGPDESDALALCLAHFQRKSFASIQSCGNKETRVSLKSRYDRTTFRQTRQQDSDSIGD